ncbi:hypothetical protein [Clostridium polynesiense]|uniref:hypothetical protein n=1 Tax=Clostridium polynesiense TaxID=1325933 RepID=UPI000590276A|nr:hypothetical protein [Clostridium polynesiense]
MNNDTNGLKEILDIIENTSHECIKKMLDECDKVTHIMAAKNLIQSGEYINILLITFNNSVNEYMDNTESIIKTSINRCNITLNQSEIDSINTMFQECGYGIIDTFWKRYQERLQGSADAEMYYNTNDLKLKSYDVNK